MNIKEMLDSSSEPESPSSESAPRSSHCSASVSNPFYHTEFTTVPTSSQAKARASSRFTGDDANEDGERLVAAIEVALEDEAEQLRKKIIKVEQLGYAGPCRDLVEARRRLAEIDEILSK